MSVGYAQVALPLPLYAAYTYRIPDALADRIVTGARVVVPVRGRRVVAIVLSVGADAPAIPPRDVLEAPDDEPAVTAPILRTARWVADYYGAPIGLALRATLPAAMWGATRTDAERATERILALSADSPSLLEREQLFSRRRRQRELYEALESLGGRAPVRHVVEQLGFGDALVRALVRSGLARVELAERFRDPFAGTPAAPPPTDATSDQQAALAAIEALPPGGGAPAWRDRQREDVRLPGGGAPRARRGAGGHRARAGDRAHAADGEPAPRRLRRPGGRAAQRALRR